MENLPDEMLINILYNSDVKDILNLRASNKQFRYLSYDNRLWHHLLLRDIYSKKQDSEYMYYSEVANTIDNRVIRDYYSDEKYAQEYMDIISFQKWLIAYDKKRLSMRSLQEWYMESNTTPNMDTIYKYIMIVIPNDSNPKNFMQFKWDILMNITNPRIVDCVVSMYEIENLDPWVLTELIYKNEQYKIEALLNRGVDPNTYYIADDSRREWNEAPILNVAVEVDNIDIVNLLLRYGANPKRGDTYNGINAFSLARNKPKILHVLQSVSSS
jgi:hypothetical protein